ncbi:4'-phosphopantetheinyl transferase family protein [Brevibacillus dissolubilis]|uniref:4'-phosphopantetheinyl transferase family protein n=1 Tax=Brevibacillus dissolubilis TaxID=1844116 RepID=UPI001117390A|nr:4'-phosphopantetheinyl transferase superfamily protein [Brevibacillus dissolubilis]
MMEVYGVHLTENWEPELFETLISLVPPEKQAKLGRYRRYEDAQRSLAAELLIRTIIARKLNLTNNEIRFAYNDQEKPSLIGADDFYFNLSHSGEWVVCAIDSQTIGIDVEVIKPNKRNMLAIAQRFFSPAEVAELLALPEELRHSRFFDYWSLKESYIKADGKGLSLGLGSFTIQFREDGAIRVETENRLRDCYFRQYDVDPAYKLGVCAMHNQFPEQVVVLSPKQLAEDSLALDAFDGVNNFNNV